METENTKKSIEKILLEIRKLEKAEAEKRDLDGYLDCDEVCEIAIPIFKKYGFNVKPKVGIINGQSHMWLETNEIIIDPTADQFSLPKIRKKEMEVKTNE